MEDAKKPMGPAPARCRADSACRSRKSVVRWRWFSAVLRSCMRRSSMTTFFGASAAGRAAAEAAAAAGMKDLLVIFLLNSHDVKAGVHIDDIAGDAAAEIACKKDGGIADLGGLRLAAQGRVRDEIFNQLRGVLDPP